jgi:hypothetical protein
MAAMAPADGTQNNSTSTNARALHMLRKELAAFDAVTLGLSHRLPSLASVETEIVQQSDSLEKPIFKYLCFLDLDNEGRKSQSERYHWRKASQIHWLRALILNDRRDFRRTNDLLMRGRCDKEGKKGSRITG